MTIYVEPLDLKPILKDTHFSFRDRLQDKRIVTTIIDEENRFWVQSLLPKGFHLLKSHNRQNEKKTLESFISHYLHYVWGGKGPIRTPEELAKMKEGHKHEYDVPKLVFLLKNVFQITMGPDGTFYQTNNQFQRRRVSGLSWMTTNYFKWISNYELSSRKVVNRRSPLQKVFGNPYLQNKEEKEGEEYFFKNIPFTDEFYTQYFTPQTLEKGITRIDIVPINGGYCLKETRDIITKEVDDYTTELKTTVFNLIKDSRDNNGSFVEHKKVIETLTPFFPTLTTQKKKLLQKFDEMCMEMNILSEPHTHKNKRGRSLTKIDHNTQSQIIDKSSIYDHLSEL